MKNILRSLAALVAALLLSAGPLSAQTALTATTLGAIADATQGNVTVAAATGITAPGTGANLVYLLVDRELMGVQAVNGLNVRVARGANGTRATAHVSGAIVNVAPAIAVINYVPSGACVRANLNFVPMIVGGTNAQGMNGTTFDCLGVTTAGQWVSTNVTDVSVLGSTMASTAGVLGLPTGTVFIVSGTNAIMGITLPAGAAPGFRISIVPSGVFTWTAATNIALAGTAVVNKLLDFVWSGTKWVPSYIA